MVWLVKVKNLKTFGSLLVLWSQRNNRLKNIKNVNKIIFMKNKQKNWDCKKSSTWVQDIRSWFKLLKICCLILSFRIASRFELYCNLNNKQNYLQRNQLQIITMFSSDEYFLGGVGLTPIASPAPHILIFSSNIIKMHETYKKDILGVISS